MMNHVRIWMWTLAKSQSATLFNQMCPDHSMHMVRYGVTATLRFEILSYNHLIYMLLNLIWFYQMFP